MYLGGGIAPTSQIVGSLMIPPTGKAGQENDVSITSMDSIDSNI
jgi:hypothetical protein